MSRRHAASHLTIALVTMLATLGATTSVLAQDGGPTLSTAADDAGLARLNELRAVAGLPAVTGDPELTAGARDHARYTAATGRVGHDQDPAHALATSDGAQAAAVSNVSLWSTTGDPFGARGMLDLLHVAPFHGLLHLQPGMTTTGVGYAREGDREAVVVDVRRGVDPAATRPDHPIAFPGPGSTTDLRRYTGGEYPDPLGPCPGLEAPVGAPVLVTFPEPPTLDAVTVTGPDGGELSTCWYDAGRYSDDDPVGQETGRSVLGNQNALVIMPRDPLVTGRHRVLLDLGDAGPATWSFTVGSSMRASDGWIQMRPEADDRFTEVCPVTSLPPSPFDDVAPGAHAHAIACGVSWDLLSGTSDATFSPTGSVTRGQTASLLFRLLTRAGVAPTTDPDIDFPDLGSTDVHREAIRAVASAGVLTGNDDGTFASGDAITRAQFVAALSRTLTTFFDRPAAAVATPSFDDVAVPSVHADAIEQLAALDIVTGVDERRFAPHAEVRRDQAAAFLLRTAALLVGDGELAAP